MTVVYEEGLGKEWEARAEYWKNPTLELREQYKSAFAKDTVIGQYTFGTEEDAVSPDGYSLDLYYASPFFWWTHYRLFLQNMSEFCCHT